MRTAMALVMAFAGATILGCMSPQGGGMAKEEGFKIQVPTFDTNIKQGDRRTVTVSVNRGELFKQDVRLHAKASPGIAVSPSDVTVKAGDKGDVQFQISVPKDAALSEYRIYLAATPTTGQPTSIDFTVKVVAP
jgi:uncharacterized membrane protein